MHGFRPVSPQYDKFIEYIIFETHPPPNEKDDLLVLNVLELVDEAFVVLVVVLLEVPVLEVVDAGAHGFGSGSVFSRPCCASPLLEPANIGCISEHCIRLFSITVHDLFKPMSSTYSCMFSKVENTQKTSEVNFT